MLVLRRSLWSIPLSLAAACSGPSVGTDVGNGRSVVELQSVGFEAKLVTTRSLTLGSGTRIDRALVAIERVRLSPGTNCEEGPTSEIDAEGPFVSDLVGVGFLATPPRFEVDAGSYCALELAFHKLDAVGTTGAPAELVGLSMLVRGVRADGVAFEIRSERGEEFELGAKSGAFALGEGVQPLILAYELSSWIDAVELDTLTGDPIVVSPSENADRLDAFEKAVEESARLFEDRDRDGELGDDEASDDDALADGRL